jgi:SAM-dependent methyltransferase
VHDLNIPVPAHLNERFDTVIDGGTLEHVFNFPEAIKSAMQMVKAGGRLFIMTPANNYFGHGFYQFGPELFYRVLSAENGYRVERMIALVEDGGFSRLFGRPYFFRLTSRWYSVGDPNAIRKRVTLLSTLPVTLFIEAKRTSAEQIFGRSPQQSDYSVQWAKGNASNTAQIDSPDSGRKWMFSADRLPDWVRWRFLPALVWLADPLRLVRWKRRNSFLNREFFREVTHTTRRHP